MIPSEQLPPTDHTITEPVAEPVKAPAIAAGHSRRTFLFTL
jgi:menaquinol-cytochrome c reductase iron-sulfur subunit